MARICNLVAALGFLAFALVGVPGAAQAEKRIALVIGNAGYQAGALATPANDAGLIAQTLQAAGFDVVGARDLDQDTLRHAFRDFVEKATASGSDSDTVAFIYASGYGRFSSLRARIISFRSMRALRAIWMLQLRHLEFPITSGRLRR